MQAVLALLVVILIIVTVHEYGHYIVGRICGIHAEVFSIGFGRPLWSRVDRHGTRWQIAAIPLGGYVRFLGDANAASGPGDVSGLSAAERRHTMPGAPLWARSATVIAGPAFNLILTLALMTGLILWSGVEEEAPVIASATSLPGSENPFLQGDRILSLNGQPTPDFDTLSTVGKDLKDAALVTYAIEREGKPLTFDGPNPVPPLVSSVYPKSAAEAAGVQKGDLILTVEGNAITGFDQMPPLVSGAEGKPVALTVRRGDEVLSLSLTPSRFDLPKADGSFETRWLIGINGGLIFEPEVRRPGPIEAVSLAVTKTWFLAKLNMNGIAQVIGGSISSCNISSPIGMAKAASAAVSAGPDAFIGTLALISLGIGLLNLFPIPVLDGGHLVFYLYEAVTRRPPNAKAQQMLMSHRFRPASWPDGLCLFERSVLVQLTGLAADPAGSYPQHFVQNTARQRDRSHSNVDRPFDFPVPSG